jgi:hypothetical protein
LLSNLVLFAVYNRTFKVIAKIALLNDFKIISLKGCRSGLSERVYLIKFCFLLPSSPSESADLA